MRWLEAGALVAFAVLLVSSAVHIRRGAPRRGSSQALAAWLIVGVVVLAVGIYAVSSTW